MSRHEHQCAVRKIDIKSFLTEYVKNTSHTIDFDNNLANDEHRDKVR